MKRVLLCALFVSVAAAEALADASCVPPVITTPLASCYTIDRGGSQPLSVSVTGTNLHYRWYYYGFITGNQITIANTPTATAEPYYIARYGVEVSNECGSVTSETWVCFWPGTWWRTESIDDNTVRLWFGGECDPYHHAWWQWYQGASGDTTHPIGDPSAPNITVSRMPASQYWVRATCGCGTYDTEAITVVPLVTPPDIPMLPPRALIGLILALAAAGVVVLRNVAS